MKQYINNKTFNNIIRMNKIISVLIYAKCKSHLDN